MTLGETMLVAPLRKEGPRPPVGAWILIVILLNLGLAAWLDDQVWRRGVDQMHSGGYAALAGYPPLYAHWLWLCSRLPLPALALRMVLLLPVLGCQAMLVWWCARRRGPEASGWLLPLAALNPALLLAGPLLGQFVLVHATLLGFGLLLLIGGKRPLLVMPALALALVANAQVLCLLPVLLALSWHRPDQRLWAGVLPALLLVELVLLPYWFADCSPALFGHFHFGTFPAATLHADNLWLLLGRDGLSDRLPLFVTALLPPGLRQQLTPHQIGETLFMVWSLWLLVSGLMRNEPEHHWRNAVLAALGFFLLWPDQHAADLVPAAVLALMAAAQYPRFVPHAAVLSLAAAADLLLTLGGRQDSAGALLLAGFVLAYALYAPAWRRAPQGQAGQGRLVWLLAAVLAPAAALALRPGPSSRQTLPPPSSGSLVDLTQVAGLDVQQGWGSLHIDTSVEGHTLTVGGQTWDGGFGTHAPSQIHLKLPPGVRRFTAAVGLDQEAHGGRAAFKVFADGAELWDSGLVLSDQPARQLDLDVSGRQALDLVVEPVGSMDYDHADWLEPRLKLGS